MRRSLFVLLTICLIGCGGPKTANAPGSCGIGRTEVDGVCVSNAVADYVACVRSQGAQLGSDRANKLSAEAGYLGVQATAVAEVRDKLEKKYTVSSASELEVIRTCSRFASGGTDLAGPAPTERDRWSRGLAGAWKLDESSGDVLHDSSSNKNEGLMDPQVEHAPGRIGRALRFPGGKASVRVNSADSLLITREVTITAWVSSALENTPALTWSAIVAKGPTAPPATAEGYTTCSSNCPEYRLLLNSAGQLEFDTSSSKAEGYYGFVRTNEGAIHTGQWQHVAVTYNVDTRHVKLFVDGEVAAAVDFGIAVNLLNGPEPLVIGNTANGTMGFRGLIDDVRVWRRTLSDSEIEELARVRE